MMPYPYHICDIIIFKNLSILIFIQTEYFLQKNSFFKMQLVDLWYIIIDKNPYAVGLRIIARKRKLENIFMEFVDNFVLFNISKEEGGDWVLSKDDVVACWGIIWILCHSHWAIIVHQESFPMFFVRTHAAHVDCIIVMAQIFGVIGMPVRTISLSFFCTFSVRIRTTIEGTILLSISRHFIIFLLFIIIQ